MYLVRPDAAQVASVEVTTDKARTAAIYRRPSKDFEDQASGGRPSALHLARAVPLQGGDADRVRRRGDRRRRRERRDRADEDRELAELGVALDPGGDRRPRNGGDRTARRYFPAEAVDEKFRDGGLLLDDRPYKVDAGRREGPGEAESTSASSTSCTW